MKKVVVVICLFLTIFLSGCNTLNKRFDKIEGRIKLSIPNLIYENINLMTEDLKYNATISWVSSNEEILSSNGEYKNETDTTLNVTLTYTITIEDNQRIGEIKVDVRKKYIYVQLDRVEQTTVYNTINYSDKYFDLPTEDKKYNATIEWWSSNEDVISSSWENKNTTQDTIEVIVYYRITIDGYIRDGQRTFYALKNWKTVQLDYVEKDIIKSIPSTTMKDIVLNKADYGSPTKLKWESSNEQVIDKNGIVCNFSDYPVIVTLTYTITVEDYVRVGTIQVEVPPTEVYTFKLKSDYIYVGVNHKPDIRAVIYKNNKAYNYSKIEYEILGNYDLTKPGIYEVIASVTVNARRQDENGMVYMGTITFEQPFTLEVVGLEYVNMKELNNFSFSTPYKTLSVDKYFIVCYTDIIYVYDLDNQNEYQSIPVKGICNEFYYKNGYLYICSSNVDQMSGYVTQINLKTYSIIKEYEIDFVPYSIVIDQRNNAILSSEKQSYIKYLDMKTGNISSICECMEKDRIIYNEDEDIFILVGRNRKKEEKIYKYDSLTNQFKLSNIQTNILKYFNLGTYIMESFKNTWLTNDYYVVLEDEDITIKELVLIEWDFRSTDIKWYNEEENFIILRYKNFLSIGYITVFNKITQSYQNYKIENYVPAEYTNIHIYNNNIYMFDSKTNKLYIIE